MMSGKVVFKICLLINLIAAHLSFNNKPINGVGSKFIHLHPVQPYGRFLQVS